MSYERASWYRHSHQRKIRLRPTLHYPNGASLKMRNLTLLLVFIAILMGPHAKAQVTKQEKFDIVTKTTSEINRAIKNHRGGNELREKVVRRLAECSFLYSDMVRYGDKSQAAPDKEIKAKVADASEISSEVMISLAAGFDLDRYKELLRSANDTLRKMNERQDKKQLFLVLRNCKSFFEADEIEDAVIELMF